MNYGANSFVPIDKWPPVFEVKLNVIVSMFLDMQSHTFLVNPYY